MINLVRLIRMDLHAKASQVGKPTTLAFQSPLAARGSQISGRSLRANVPESSRSCRGGVVPALTRPRWRSRDGYCSRSRNETDGRARSNRGAWTPVASGTNHDNPTRTDIAAASTGDTPARTACRSTATIAVAADRSRRATTGSTRRGSAPARSTGRSSATVARVGGRCRQKWRQRRHYDGKRHHQIPDDNQHLHRSFLRDRVSWYGKTLTIRGGRASTLR